MSTQDLINLSEYKNIKDFTKIPKIVNIDKSKLENLSKDCYYPIELIDDLNVMPRIKDCKKKCCPSSGGGGGGGGGSECPVCIPEAQYWGEYLYWNTTTGEWTIGGGLQTGDEEGPFDGVRLGYNAGSNVPGSDSIVAIGSFAGQSNQGEFSVAIGRNAGQFTQAESAVAIGSNAGQTDQGVTDGKFVENAQLVTFNGSSIAIGTNAGCNNQVAGSIAIGSNAGNLNQGNGVNIENNGSSIAIGRNAAQENQQANAIAIGSRAGRFSQGSNAIAIGFNAGYDSVAGPQVPNSIIINALGTPLSTLTGSSNCCIIAPIRPLPNSQRNNTDWKLLVYRTQNGTGFSGNDFEVQTLQNGLNIPDSATPKTFVIPHPTDSNKYLQHACLEGPEAGVYYRGKSEITNNEFVEISLPEYTKNFDDYTVQLTPVVGDDYKKGSLDLKLYTTEVKNNKFKVFGDNGKFFWTVFGKRNSLIVEPLKSEYSLKGDGPYTYLTKN